MMDYIFLYFIGKNSKEQITNQINLICIRKYLNALNFDKGEAFEQPYAPINTQQK